MIKSIEDRILGEAEFMLQYKCTVREMSKYFYVSKSTIHNDLSKKLKKMNFNLFKKVDKILKYNLSQRHLRGGEATKLKYIKKKKDRNKKVKFLPNI